MIDDDGSLSPRRGSFDDVVGEAMRAEELRTALDTVASSSRNAGRRSGGWTSSEDEADPMEQDEDSESLLPDSELDRNASFKEHRRAHYDEFRKVKELRRKGSFFEDKDDDENGDNKLKDGRCDSSSSLSAGVKDIDIEEGSPASPHQSYLPPTNGV
ncbi:hypothetical protein GH714_027208 [Hevea brasiliensis]|nr:hypothetical protein GH714_027208 [Hevea brasiliensis]